MCSKFTVFPTKRTPFHYVLMRTAVCNLPVITAFYIRFEKTYHFPTKVPFSDAKRWQRCALSSLKKKKKNNNNKKNNNKKRKKRKENKQTFLVVFFFFVQASVSSRLASPHPPGTNVSPSMTYAHLISPACRVVPTFFFFFVAHLCRMLIGELKV